MRILTATVSLRVFMHSVYYYHLGYIGSE